MSKLKIVDMIRAMDKEIQYRYYTILPMQTQTGYVGKIIHRGKVVYISPNMPSKHAVQLHCKHVIQELIEKE